MIHGPYNVKLRRAMYVKRYFKARSRNYYCRGKTTLHILSVCL